MSAPLYWGLVLAVLLIIALIITAYQHKKDPPLESAIGIVLGGVSVTGSMKLFAVTFSDYLSVLPPVKGPPSWAALVPDDGLFLFISGLALLWVSARTIWDCFSKVKG